MIVIVPAVALALVLAPAQDQPVIDQPAAQAGSQQGTIIMYRRGSVMGAALGCPIRYQGNELVELGRSKAFQWEVKPGRFILENKTSSIEVTVEPGETRYVRCQIKTGFLTGRADLQIVDGTEYKELKDQFEAPGS